MFRGLHGISKNVKPKADSKYVTTNEEESSVEIIKTSNCVINIDYFVKDEKFSLELQKNSVDSKRVRENFCSTKNQDKNKERPEIWYQNISKKVKQRTIRDCNKSHRKNEQPVKSKLVHMDKTHKDNFISSGYKMHSPKSKPKISKSYCSIYFDGTRSIKRKKGDKKTSNINSELVSSHETSVQIWQNANNKLAGNSIDKERRQTKHHREHKHSSIPKEFLNKKEKSVRLENKKHAKLEIILSPRSDITSLSDKTENSPVKKKKVILKSNTLKVDEATNRKCKEKEDLSNNETTPLEFIDLNKNKISSDFIDLNKNKNSSDDELKFYKRRHKNRNNPIILTMSTFVCADIKGINIFSNLQDSNKKTSVPHRPVNSDVIEPQPYYIPIPKDKNEQVETNKGDKVIETQQTFSEIVKCSQIPRRFIGNNPKEIAELSNIREKSTFAEAQNNNTDRNNINTDDSSETLTESTIHNQSKIESEKNNLCITVQSDNYNEDTPASRVVTENSKLNENELIEKFKSFSEDDNPQFADFCKFMFNIMNQQSSRLDSEGDFQNFMKMGKNIFKNLNNTATKNENSNATNLRSKSPETGRISVRSKSPPNRSARNDKQIPVLRRKNAIVKEETPEKKEKNINSTRLRKVSEKHANTKLVKPGKNTRLSEGDTHNSPHGTFQKVVKKFTISKNQGKYGRNKNITCNRDEQLSARKSPELNLICHIDDNEINNSKTSIQNKDTCLKNSTQNINTTLSARESLKSSCIEEMTDKKMEDDDNSNKNICSKNSSKEFKRSRTFPTKMECMKNEGQDANNDFVLIPLTKNITENKTSFPGKFSTSTIVQECCCEKSKNSKTHSPGCIHNSSFLFTKCNTEHNKDSSFQKRKEYNKNWRRQFKEKKEYGQDLQSTNESPLDDEKMTELKILQERIQNFLCDNSHPSNRKTSNQQISRQISQKLQSKTTLSKTKHNSGHQLSDTCKSTNRFSRINFTTSIFAFPYQEKPRKNYAEVDLPSFICPDKMWIQQGNSPKNEAITNAESNTTSQKTDIVLEQNLPSSETDKYKNEVSQEIEKTGLESELLKVNESKMEYTNILLSNNTTNSKKSLPKSKSVKRKYSVLNKIRNRFSFSSYKQNKKINLYKKRDSLYNISEKQKTASTEQWFRSVKPKHKSTSNTNVKSCLKGTDLTSKRRRQYVNEIRKNLITGKIYSNKTISFVRDTIPEVKEVIHSDEMIQVVHQNANFLKYTDDKSLEIDHVKQSKESGINNQISDDTILNCNSSEIFGDNLSGNDVKLLRSDSFKSCKQIALESDNPCNTITLNSHSELPKENKKVISKKSTKMFSIHKMSSHIGKLFRGKK